MSIASAVLAGAGTVLTWAVTSLGGSLVGWMALWWGARACPGVVSPGVVRQKDLSFFSSKAIRPYRHFPGTTRRSGEACGALMVSHLMAGASGRRVWNGHSLGP